MAIVINGSGTVTGLAVGGLPDGTVDAGTLATNSVDSAELVDGSIDSSHLASGVGGVAGISSSADATAMTITSDEKVLVNETVSGHADAGTTVITNKALGKAALTLKSLQTHVAGVGTEIVALNFAAHNYYSASNPGIYGQISCENGNGSYSDRGQLVLSTGYGGNQITERLVLTSDGRGLSQFTARAWARINQTGTQAITMSHNCSSVSDNGTGDSTVNFTNAIGSTQYCVVTGNAAENEWSERPNPTVTATGSVRLQNVNHSSTFRDSSRVHFAVYMT